MGHGVTGTCMLDHFEGDCDMMGGIPPQAEERVVPLFRRPSHSLRVADGLG